jgi:hypothetical protein
MKYFAFLIQQLVNLYFFLFFGVLDLGLNSDSSGFNEPGCETFNKTAECCHFPRRHIFKNNNKLVFCILYYKL